MRYGETVDLTALYETYSDLLLRTILTYAGHSEDAQDITHDMLAAYSAKRPMFQDTSHQRVWMLYVTINKCRDPQCHNAIRRYAPSEDVEHVASPKGSEISELLAAVRSLLDKLHEVMVPHYLEGFSVEETTRCLRISVSAVKMRLTHGRQAIKVFLGTEE